MIRLLWLLPVALMGCVPTSNGFDPGIRDIAAQRMRFVAEAVCLTNRTRSAQDRAARGLGFPIRQRDDGATIYINPNTLTFLRLGPAPEQSITTPEGREVVSVGHGCSVGSPAVTVELANRLTGEILASRLVDGSDLLARPVGAGTNSAGGAGFFFEDLAVTLPFATTSFTDETGAAQAFDHPVILIVHN
ncbi:MAG: hypothetical protein AAF919_19205 [Pseudomonadota bacterium]